MWRLLYARRRWRFVVGALSEHLAAKDALCIHHAHQFVGRQYACKSFIGTLHQFVFLTSQSQHLAQHALAVGRFQAVGLCTM